MPDIIIPFRLEGLPVKPELAGRIRLSDDMQQTLASLVGFDDIARRLLRCSKGGILHTTTPRLDNIVHVTTAAGTGLWQGSDKKITEVMIMAHPDNNGLLWIKNDEAATANNGWPLAANAILNVTLYNLNNLHILSVTPEEKAIIAYTR